MSKDTSKLEEILRRVTDIQGDGFGGLERGYDFIDVEQAKAELEQLIKEKQAEAEEKKRKEINRMIFSAEPYDKGEGWVALKFSEGLYRNIAGEIAFNDRIAELEGDL